MASTRRFTGVLVTFALALGLCWPSTGWAAAKAPTTAPAPGARDDDPPFEQLRHYYQNVLGGLITPTPGAPDLSIPVEDWFRIDVEGFNRYEQSQDFLTAKYRYYSQQPYNSKTGMHERPYYYHSSWRSLFHPPIKQMELPLEAYDAQMAPQDPSQVQSAAFNPDFQRRLDQMTDTELSFGNKLRLLPNHNSFDEKLRMVRESKKFFFGVVMVYFCDASTKLLLDEMVRKKNEGVDVRMIVEGLWGRTVASPCVVKMRKAGIPVTYIMDFLKPESFVSVMHHKIWIRDGVEAIIGGQNMHENSNYATGFNHRTRDTDVLIESGPAVTDLLKEYTNLWRKYASGKKAKESIEPYQGLAEHQLAQERVRGQRGQENYERVLSNPETRSDGVCRMLVQNNGASRQPTAPVRAEYFREAQRQIIVTSPSIGYRTDGKKADRWPQIWAKLLKEAGRDRGVNVEVLSNGVEGGSGELAYVLERMRREIDKANIPLLPLLLKSINAGQNRANAKKNRLTMMDLASTSPNIRGWHYLEFLHQKTWLIDRTVAAVGSVNFDDYSTEKSHESEAICMDRKLVSELERQLTLDRINSVPTSSSNGK